MHVSCFRSIVALAITFGLAACGGKASFDVSGVISGLNNPGLVLANGGATVSPPSGATAFTFPETIDYGTDYDIVVQTQPDHMTCTVAGGSGSAGRIASISATVACAQNTYTLGGSIAGLTAAGLELANGSTAITVSPAAGATAFQFPQKVADGTTYGVTVLTQPPGLTCSVDNRTAAGTMGGANVANLAVTCAPAP